MYDWKLVYKPDEKKLDLVFTGRQFRGLLDSLKLIIASFLQFCLVYAKATPQKQNYADGKKW